MESLIELKHIENIFKVVQRKKLSVRKKVSFFILSASLLKFVATFRVERREGLSKHFCFESFEPAKKIEKRREVCQQNTSFFRFVPIRCLRMQKKLLSVFDVAAEHDFTKRFYAKKISHLN